MDAETSGGLFVKQKTKRKQDRQENDAVNDSIDDVPLTTEGDDAERSAKRIRLLNRGDPVVEEDVVAKVEQKIEASPEAGSPHAGLPLAEEELRGSDGEFIETAPFLAGRRPPSQQPSDNQDRVNISKEQHRGQRFGTDIWPALYSGPLPEELLAMCGTMRCALCDLRLSSAIVAKSHYLGRNHERKTNTFLNEWAQSTNQVPPRRILENMEEVRSGDERFCELCRVELTSKITAMAHYQGRNHARQKLRLKKEQLEMELAHAAKRREENSCKENTEGNENSTLKDIRENKASAGNDVEEKSLEKDSRGKVIASLEEIFDDKDQRLVKYAFGEESFGENPINETSRFFCVPCQRDCRLRTDYEAHISSQDHKEKSRSLQSYFSCRICKFHCYSQDDFDAHMQSAEHQIKEIRTNVEQSQEAVVKEEGFEHWHEDEIVTPSSNNKFHCNLCQSMVSGPDNLKTHLEGRGHKRRLEMMRGPESHSVVCVNPSYQGMGMESFPFFCDVCQIQTTDQAGLEMHRNGRKHRKKLARR